MRFLIDADLPRTLKNTFEKHSHEAILVRDLFGEASDSKIFDYAKKNKAIIVTKDLGFGQRFSEEVNNGLILARLPYRFTTDKINEIFDRFLNDVEEKSLVAAITVVELGRYRIRRPDK